jgi:hypothetical protein
MQMVMQAKLERRRRRQSDQVDQSGHPENIPPPSEPVHNSDAKQSLDKSTANGPALTPVPNHVMYRGTPQNAAYVSEPVNGRVASPPANDDKTDAKFVPAAQKGVTTLNKLGGKIARCIIAQLFVDSLASDIIASNSATVCC